MSELMKAEIAFRRQNVVNVDAAVVGVSRARWISIRQEATVQEARDAMAAHRFDVLPIDDGKRCREYFGTAAWGDFSSVSRSSIRHSDVLPYDVSLRDVIRGMGTENRRFFFLVDEGEIAGLISIANLNCRQVALFVFGLLVEIEVRLGELIQRRIGDGFQDALRTVCSPEKYKDISERLDADRSKGLDVSIGEYVYLPDLVNVVPLAGLHKELGYSRSSYTRDAGSLVELRNRVAHPSRSLLTSDHSVERLWKRIDRAESLLFALR